MSVGGVKLDQMVVPTGKWCKRLFGTKICVQRISGVACANLLALNWRNMMGHKTLQAKVENIGCSTSHVIGALNARLFKNGTF